MSLRKSLPLSPLRPLLPPLTARSRLEKHLDTLFKITHSSNFNTSIQALMLIQQVAVSKYLAVERFYRTLYESLLDPRLITSSKQALYLNLLYRSLKNDVDVRRVKAFVKRMLQVVTLHQASFTCGILYLIAELGATFPDLKTLLTEPEQDDDDGEEVYKDVVEGGEVNGNGERSEPVTKRTVYDGRKRDPEYSNAQQSCLWELVSIRPCDQSPLPPYTNIYRCHSWSISTLPSQHSLRIFWSRKPHSPSRTLPTTR